MNEQFEPTQFLIEMFHGKHFARLLWVFFIGQQTLSLKILSLFLMNKSWICFLFLFLVKWIISRGSFWNEVRLVEHWELTLWLLLDGGFLIVVALILIVRERKEVLLWSSWWYFWTELHTFYAEYFIVKVSYLL